MAKFMEDVDEPKTVREMDQEEEREKSQRPDPSEDRMRVAEVIALEERRVVENQKKMILETLTVMYRDYNIKGLRYFRNAVESAATQEEIKTATEMLVILSKIHDAVAIK